ncbi:hypothetical protein QA612_13700 [Evansella sp. AB-P1]|uniref:hypothetical protein n=1 Tax=Evansella sp. AB-P1 TaxID=3037653 RepID=UPI00241E05FC|nr:hypothetical protein [Evansella sp. AB-P1]MDG5788536.1 hypothetical protein [Evansella sp. AB-P1]
MATTILTILICAPVYGILVWTYFYPEDSMLFLERWKYNEEPEFSELAIANAKFSAVFGIYIITIFILITIFQHYFFSLLFVLGIFLFIVYYLLALRKKFIK